MKKQLNLQLDSQMDMVQEVAFKSLAGITVGEISELRLMQYELNTSQTLGMTV